MEWRPHSSLLDCPAMEARKRRRAQSLDCRGIGHSQGRARPAIAAVRVHWSAARVMCGGVVFGRLRQVELVLIGSQQVFLSRYVEIDQFVFHKNTYAILTTRFTDVVLIGSQHATLCTLQCTKICCGRPVTCAYICRTNMDIILFRSKSVQRIGAL